MFEGIIATLPAADISRAKAFYRDKVGIEPFQVDEGGSARYQVGDTMMMLYPSEFAGTNKATAVGFGVKDIAAALSTLRGRGVEFADFDYGDMKTVDGIMEFPDGSKGAWFTDSEGNVVGVFQDSQG